MSGALELRSAINGYNKRDVELYIQTLITENEKQVAEFKRRFDEAMKMADEKDDKCYLLESKIDELKANIAELERAKAEQPASSSENITQLLGSLEESRNQNAQLSAALKAAEGQIESLKAVAAVAPSAGVTADNSAEIARLQSALDNGIREAAELRKVIDSQKDIIAKYEAEASAASKTPGIPSFMHEDGQLVSVEHTYDMVTADAIEYAGQIISNAKEDAKQVIDNMKAVCCEAYDHVLKISDAIKMAQNEFSISIVDVEKMLGDIEQDINMFPAEEPNPYVQPNEPSHYRHTQAGAGDPRYKVQ